MPTACEKFLVPHSFYSPEDVLQFTLAQYSAQPLSPRTPGICEFYRGYPRQYFSGSPPCIPTEFSLVEVFSTLDIPDPVCVVLPTVMVAIALRTLY